MGIAQERKHQGMALQHRDPCASVRENEGVDPESTGTINEGNSRNARDSTRVKQLLAPTAAQAVSETRGCKVHPERPSESGHLELDGILLDQETCAARREGFVCML
jgi:hypothetical protein